MENGNRIKRVMFVCHGNICRSPMAEMISRDLCAKRGITGLIFASSATSTEEIWNGVGNPVYPPARAELLRHGIDPKDKRAVQLSAADYDHYDLFVGMDSANIRNMMRIFHGDPQQKVRKLMEYTKRGGDVSDPWYTDRFDVAFADIFEGCEALLGAILAQKS